MPSGSIEFVDTNILVYEWDHAAPEKQKVAQNLVLASYRRLCISSQVAQEFTHTALRKLKMLPSRVDMALGGYRDLRFVQVDLEMVLLANRTAEQSQISFWDALIVEAAVAGGCKTLWTEDLSHGQVIRGVKIKNPFK